MHQATVHVCLRYWIAYAAHQEKTLLQLPRLVSSGRGSTTDRPQHASGIERDWD